MWVNPDADLAPASQDSGFVRFYDPSNNNMLIEVGIA